MCPVLLAPGWTTAGSGTHPCITLWGSGGTTTCKGTPVVLEHDPGPGEASRAQQFTTNHPSTQTETTAARLCPKPRLCSPSHLQTIQAGLPFPPPSQSMEGFSPSCSRRVVTSWPGHWMTPTRGDGDGFGNSSDGGWGRFPLVFIPSVVPSLC